MFRISYAIILAFISVALLACQPTDRYKDQFWVISDHANLHERPETLSKTLKELKFGDEVWCRDQNPSYPVDKGWVETRSGTIRGFMEKRMMAAKDTYDEIQKLMAGAKETSVQAAGMTKKRASLRLKPQKDAFLIARLKEPARANVLERLVMTVGDKDKPVKQVWYKIRLGDGRTGFVSRSDFQLIPPAELNAYTAVREPVTWYALGTKEDPASGGKGTDYLVTYSSVGSDIDTDFTRVEIYTYEPRTKQYATSLAKSSLYGILPLKITGEDGGNKTIEIREHPRGDKKKVHVIEYSYPSPIKVIKEYNKDAVEG